MNNSPAFFITPDHLPRHATRAMLLSLALIAGCASFGDNAPKSTVLAAGDAGASGSVIDGPGDRWWQAYGDPQLNALIDRALAQSPSLKLAEARMRRAQAVSGVADAARKLQINGNIDSTYQRFPEHGLLPPPFAGENDSINNANLNIGLDLDFFGRNRAALDAALGQVAAARADAAAARVVLAANVAKTWFNLARLIEQRNVATATLALREQTRMLVQQRVANGLDTNVELRQAEGGLPGTRFEIAQLDEQIALARNALAALIGGGPDVTRDMSPQLAAAREQALPANIPADLVGRRADIAAARARVTAALREIDVTKAEFYPNVNLTAFAGFGSIGYATWFDAGSRQYGIGPAISIPIFAGGRLRATLAGKGAEYDAAVESYNQILLDAVRDVADQIASTQSLAIQTKEQRDAQTAAESAYELALKRYQAGLTNYLIVLTAENTVLAQRRLATDLKARALELNVNLARALGGGYQDAVGTASIKTASTASNAASTMAATASK
ncbi:MAG TPA: efflux transporter outer membrane subunit [Usitatibacteraceae bacterium]